MEESSRRSVLKGGLAAVGGLFGLGAAAKVAGGLADGGSRPPSQTITLHGRNWQISSQSRQAGEFPTAAEHMLISGELLDGPEGSRLGDFYATYFGLSRPGHTGADGSSSLQTHTFNLRDGTLVGTGTGTPALDTEDTFAVIGGTGRYTGARGSYVARQSPAQFGGDGTAMFTITLVP
jgi:hypothetical protein